MRFKQEFDDAIAKGLLLHNLYAFMIIFAIPVNIMAIFGVFLN